MQRVSDSWLGRSARGVVVLGSLLVAEASQATLPNPPPLPEVTEPTQPAPEPQPLPENNKPDPFKDIKDDFLRRILPILARTRVKDDAARLKALQELKTALEPRPNCDMMKATQLSLIAELTINNLQKQLEGVNDYKAQAAATELSETWLKDENSFIRDRVQRLLSRHPKFDQRRRPPDVSDLTAPLEDIGVIKSLEEWEKHKGVAKMIIRMQKEILQFKEHDYFTREAASARLAALITELRKTVNPLPPVILEALKPEPTLRNLDLETYNRQNKIYRLATSFGSRQYTLPRMETDAATVMGDIERIMGAKIRIDPTHVASLGNISLSLDESTRAYAQIITQLCNKTSAYPVADGHPHHLVLKPQDAKGEQKTVIALDRMIAVITPGEKGKPDIIDLLPDPSFTFIQIDAASTNNMGSKDHIVRIGENPEWKLNSGGAPTKKSIKAKPAAADTKDEVSRPAELTIEAWITSHQYTQEVRLKEGGAIFHDNGPHDFDITTTEDSGTKVFATHIRIGAYERSIPWPNTPFESDALTWGMADSITFQFFNAEGKEIGSTKGEIEINQRAVSMDCSLSTFPVSVNVTSPRHINKQRRTIPLDGRPSTDTVLKPFFETRP